MNRNHDSQAYPQLHHIIIVLLITLGLIFIISFIGALLGAKTGLFLLEFLIIVPAVIFVIIFKYPVFKVFRLRPVNKSVLAVSVLIGLGFTIIVDEFDRLIQIVFPMPDFLQKAIEESLKIQSTTDFFIIIFSAVFLAAILEEMLFRGFVQISFENTFDVTKAVMATAFLFAIIHLNPWWTIQYTLFGIILGVMAWKSSSVFPPMIVHFVNNGVALIFNNISPEKMQWYLSGNHVNLLLLAVAIIATFYGFKMFYYYCEKTEGEKMSPLNQNAPKVRIGVLQSTEEVIFKSNSPFSIKDDSDKIVFSGAANERYKLSIASAQPANLRYQVRAGIETEKKIAESRMNKLKNDGLNADLRCVGVDFKIDNHGIDNREYWIVIGDFASREEALAFREKQENSGEFVVVENIIQPTTGVIELNGENLGAVARIIPDQFDNNTCITVSNIIIGIQFHWQKLEDLDYRGVIEVGFNNQGKLVVINEVDIESYLTSVNSSEMTSDCPLGLLEAQTVVARSTVFATMGKHHYNTNFHLCSDDHCQCYHGKKREQKISCQAVENTWGEVIMHQNQICDARYSKICGGIIEAYHNVWENRRIPYMLSGVDSEQKIDYPANTEIKAKQLIDDKLPAYCNTEIYKLPPKLADLYSTENLFRWTVTYTREELEQLISEKTGENIGELQDILPLERGDSGRLIYINLVGQKKTLKIGKELEIRRVLSKSHLYSSCFYVEKEIGAAGKVQQFILKGAGWGHGVGLCQVGATVMAMKNIPYSKILEHYYQNIDLVKLYH